MPISFFSDNRDRILFVKVLGRLTREDYELCVPAIDRAIQEHGKIRILFNLLDFKGWDLGALWEDVELDLRHFNDVERIVIIGNSKWQAWMSNLCKPFTAANIKFFDQPLAEHALAWVREQHLHRPKGLLAHAGSTL